jgi:hypothetical protein
LLKGIKFTGLQFSMENMCDEVSRDVQNILLKAEINQKDLDFSPLTVEINSLRRSVYSDLKELRSDLFKELFELEQRITAKLDIIPNHISVSTICLYI